MVQNAAHKIELADDDQRCSPQNTRSGQGGYSTELPVEVLGAKYKWARGAGLL